MKNIILILTTILFSNLASAQAITPQSSLKWAPGSLLMGNVSLQGEYSIGNKSLTAKIGIPLSTRHTLTFDGNDARFTMKAMTFMAGYRNYLSQKSMQGLYLEPFFKYVHHNSEGSGNAWVSADKVIMQFLNEYNGTGFGLQVGAQFLIAKKLVADLYFLGPEINIARNTFKGREMSSYLPWTSFEANEVEHDVRTFIESFPFIRNRTNIMVDRDNKTVTANYKGLLPGFRAGISIGAAF